MIVDGTNIHEFLNEDGTILDCSRLRVTTLTIPDTCTTLKTIHCYYNQLTSLTIPDTCTELEIIHCSHNQLLP